MRRITEEERLIQSFQEINDFVSEHGQSPERENGFKERLLAARLEALSQDSDKVSVLSSFDEFGLLPVVDILDTEFVTEELAAVAEEEVDFTDMKVTSFDDLLNADSFNLLGDLGEEQLQIFNTSNLPQLDKEREKTDFVARRKRCKDFDQYEPMFTSGTGTETIGLSVITDKEKGVKYPIVSYELTPDIAIVDGEICATMPTHIPSNTGLDALTHCVEA